MIGAQASAEQLDKILSYVQIGKGEGARVITGGERAELGGGFGRRLLHPADRVRRAQQDAHLPEEIFGPVLAVPSFEGYQQAIELANDTLYGLGAGVWTRDNTGYHAYPAFGGYNQSGFGREAHQMMLDHYQQTKNLLVSYNTKATGLS